MKKYLLNEEYIINLLENNKIGIIDGGARGDLFPPFKYLNKDTIQLFRFEPESDSDISNYSKNDVISRKALWKDDKGVNLNVAFEPSASSVYPFNSDLQKYIDPHAKLRATEKIVEVETIDLNKFIRNNPNYTIDFIKLDIHGAEYDVLKGASDVLNKTKGLLIESWVIPIHKGQKTRAHVEALAFDHQFYVFEENPLGKWVRLSKDFSKGQIVPIDTLYFKDPLIDNNIDNFIDIIKLIGIANLFGHNAYAQQLTDHFHNIGTLKTESYNFIIDFIKKYGKKTIKERIADKAEDLYAKLSYCSFK